MKANLKNWLIGGGIAIILILPIITGSINSKKIAVKSYSDFMSSVSNENFSLVYFGDTSKEEYTPYKDMLVSLKNEFKINAYTIDTKKLTTEERNSLDTLNSELQKENVYALVQNGKIVYASSNKLTEKDLKDQINKYLNNIIPDNEIYFKTVSTYKEYMALVNSKKITMAVFGRNSCSWCNKYKPVYNEVANKYNLDIYYFDSDSYDKSEYSKILNSGLNIPASCTDTKKEEPLSNGFGTPLTLYTKNGKVIDCISGYVDEDNLVKKLKSVGLIK